MLNKYDPLPSLPLASNVKLKIEKLNPPQRVTLDSPAHLVMTDFAITPAASIEPGALVDSANEYMRRRGIRSLLVVDAHEVVIGIITATDILGETAVQFAHDNGIRRSEIRVIDLMTSREQLDIIEYDSLMAMRVGHVVATVKQAGHQHLLVGQPGPAGERIRGMFSLTQVARQLGIDIQPNTFAKTFAEVEAGLSH